VQDEQAESEYDVIFYDAFGPPTQPEMWTLAIFQRMFAALKSEGIFVTYCAKGQVRRDLQAAGFTVERLPGPPGKREMLRATKPLLHG
jgi:tRNA U34 5-methylaminomethyl-2-thiouridine-forming methyltransferase MnmC